MIFMSTLRRVGRDVVAVDIGKPQQRARVASDSAPAFPQTSEASKTSEVFLFQHLLDLLFNLADQERPALDFVQPLGVNQKLRPQKKEQLAGVQFRDQH